MSQSFTLPSGATLEVSVSSFADASALRKALLKSTQGVALPKDVLEADISALKDLIVNAAISEDVEAALFKCADRALYNGMRVTPALFDDPKVLEAARKDYYAIALRIIEVNCEPFFDQLFSTLKGRLKSDGSSPSGG